MDKPDLSMILVADDSATDRLILAALLREQGHDVLCVTNGIEAIDAFRNYDLDLVLMDALMPVMDGFDAAEKIKEEAGEAFIPIIFLTSLQDADSLARCLDAGGDDFLSKPYKSIILEAKINAFIRMRRMHRTLQQQRDEIVDHNRRLVHEQEVAKRVFDKVAHGGCLGASNIKYAISPLAIFNGDVVLAGVDPAGHLMVLLGDFTGHGLDAALGAMPLAQTFYTMLSKGFGVRDIAREINQKLYEILPKGVFCCALLAEINFQNKILRTWAGGLPDCAIYRPVSGEVIKLASRHLPLGILPAPRFNEGTEVFKLEEGDRLYFWSDGIHEAENQQGEMFGEERLFDVFERNQNSDELFNDVNLAINRFIDEGEASDDISILEVSIVDFERFSAELPGFDLSDNLGPDDWSMTYTLNTDTLRNFNPLPALLNILLQVPRLRSFGGRLSTLMTELYNNALEHGVLGLDSAIKDSPEGFSHYYQCRRDQLMNLESGSIEFELHYKGDRDHGQLKVIVEDSGKGFDIEAQAKTISRSYSGRGLHLVASICDSLEYEMTGSKVVATFRWGEISAEGKDYFD